MDILHVAHDAWRDQHKKPRSRTFHPICATIEILANHNFKILDRIIGEYTWCHTIEGIKRMYVRGFEEHGPEKTILEVRDVLKALIYIDDEDTFWNILMEYPLTSQMQDLKCAYRMGRYDMIEQVVLKYPAQVYKTNDAGVLPLDLARHVFLKPRRWSRPEFDQIMLERWSAEDPDNPIDSPEGHILHLLEFYSSVSIDSERE
jgi:hypothetical protein